MMNCLLVDDEPIALNILEDHINKIPGIRLAGKCHSAVEAFSVLKTTTVDVLFLDIEMPGMNGIEFIKVLKTSPVIIVTSAYSNFAVQSFDLDVTDYLLKPIPFERFVKAIDKAYNKINSSKEAIQAPNNNFFFVKVKQDFVKVQYDKIAYIEGLENYVRIECTDKSIVTFSTMKNMEEVLCNFGFYRIHRSYIVNLVHIEALQNNCVKIGKKLLPIGNMYKKNFLAILKLKSIV